LLNQRCAVPSAVWNKIPLYTFHSVSGVVTISHTGLHL